MFSRVSFPDIEHTCIGGVLLRICCKEKKILTLSQPWGLGDRAAGECVRPGPIVTTIQLGWGNGCYAIVGVRN